MSEKHCVCEHVCYMHDDDKRPCTQIPTCCDFRPRICEDILEKVDNRIGDLHYKAQRDGMNEIATGLQQARNVIDNELQSMRSTTYAI